MHLVGRLPGLSCHFHVHAAKLLFAVAFVLSATENLAVGQDFPQIAVPPNTDGYLLHRGSGENAQAVVANAGGVGLQDKSYELRSWLPEFVLVQRSGKTYLVDDFETVRQAWSLWDASTVCWARVEAATPSIDELRSALAVCKVNWAEDSPAEAAAKQTVRDRLDPVTAATLWYNSERNSRIWKLWNESSACRAGWSVAPQPVQKLQDALSECKIAPIEMVAAQKLLERLGPDRAWARGVIEVITDSRLWSRLDHAISAGVAHQIEK
jgi:hypothetical protein